MEEVIERFKALPERDQIWLLEVLALIQEHPAELSGVLDSLREDD